MNLAICLIFWDKGQIWGKSVSTERGRAEAATEDRKGFLGRWPRGCPEEWGGKGKSISDGGARGNSGVKGSGKCTVVNLTWISGQRKWPQTKYGMVRWQRASNPVRLHCRWWVIRTLSYDQVCIKKDGGQQRGLWTEGRGCRVSPLIGVFWDSVDMT